MSSSIGPIDEALLPASVRNGSAAQKSAYSTALGFEQMLVDQLSKELSATANAGSSTDGGSGSSDSSGSSDNSDSAGTGLMSGSDPAASMYSQLLPTALTSAVMSSGGLGIAGQLAGTLTATSETKR